MTFLTPSVHVVKETPTAKLFRRKLKCQDILTFFSLETGQWILAYYVHKKIGMVDEIEDLGTNFELVTPVLVQQICACWGPIDWKAKKQRILSMARAKQRKKDDELVETQNRFDWAKKRMGGDMPYIFETPITGGERN